MRGYQKRLEAQQQVLAWHAANLMNVWVKKGSKVTPDKLLGKNTQELSAMQVTEEIKRRAEAQQEDLSVSLASQDVEHDEDETAEESALWIESVLNGVAPLDDGDTIDDEGDGEE